MKILDFDYLPKEAMGVRIEVFVKEQGFMDDMDSTDNVATHFVAYENDTAVGTCRIFKENEAYILGRLAVVKEWRNHGIGRALLAAAEKTVFEKGGSSLRLHSQTQAESFYKKCGYSAVGDIEFEQGCPHIWMEKKF